MENIIVGMSGGVDSAVSAHLLIKNGYSVEAVFMKNWEEDSKYCTSEQDYLDALQVCDILKIPLRTVNFSKQYWEKVFRIFLSEYNSGRTPNPDILCNTEIKFKEFLNYAIQLGADKIATGHYVQSKLINNKVKIYKGFDKNKDQSYFLNGLNQSQINNALFPLGNLDKLQVRKYAKELGFSNFNKKDSTGICFIGERNFKEFLKEYIPAMPGKIETSSGETIGDHDGLMYYTLGQRKGLGIGGSNSKLNAPWYVISKDLKSNTLIVDQGHNHKNLYKKQLDGSSINWISGVEPSKRKLKAKIRYRMEDASCAITELTSEIIKIKFDNPQFAITPGQSIVFYDKDECLGGAIIENAYN
jgi:tRNA-uridine 2-sulfurtransferase